MGLSGYDVVKRKLATVDILMVTGRHVFAFSKPTNSVAVEKANFHRGSTDVTEVGLLVTHKCVPKV